MNAFSRIFYILLFTFFLSRFSKDQFFFPFRLGFFDCGRALPPTRENVGLINVKSKRDTLEIKRTNENLAKLPLAVDAYLIFDFIRKTLLQFVFGSRCGKFVRWVSSSACKRKQMISSAHSYHVAGSSGQAILLVYFEYIIGK